MYHENRSVKVDGCGHHTKVDEYEEESRKDVAFLSFSHNPNKISIICF